MTMELRPSIAIICAMLALPWAAFGADDLEDDPALPMAQRLDRVEKRVVALEKVVSDVTKQDTVINAAMDAGKPLAKSLPEKLSRLNAALDSSTINTASGGGETHSLSWLCRHAQALAPQVLGLSASVQKSLDDIAPRLGAIPVGGDNAAQQLQAVTAELQAGFGQLLDSEANQTMRVELKEIDQALPFAWGAYTTLGLVVDEARSDARKLMQQVDVLATAPALEYPINQFLQERKNLDHVFASIEPEDPLDVSRRGDLLHRVSASQLPGLRQDPLGTVTSAKFFEDKWRPLATQALAEIDEVYPPAKASGSDAATPELPRECSGANSAPQKFAETRAQARAAVTQALGRAQQAIDAHKSAIDQSMRKAAEVQKTNQDTVTELDQKLLKVKARGAQLRADDAAGQKKLQELLDKGDKLRNDALQASGRMEQALVGLRAEQQALDAQKAALSALSGQAMTYFNSDSQ